MYQIGGRIIGGELADHLEFPYLVSIQRLSEGGWKNMCGGSILTPTVILTACHCVAYTTTRPVSLKSTEGVRIVAGVGNWQEQSSLRQNIAVKKFIINPSCSSVYGTHNDTALIELETPLTYNSEIQPLKLFSYKKKTAVKELRKLEQQNTQCLTPGWGIVQKIPTVVRIPSLKVAKGRLLERNQCLQKECPDGLDCEDMYHQVCTEFEDGTFCRGDSGSPLVCNGFVFGVVSHAASSCDGIQLYSDIQAILRVINRYQHGQ